MQKYIPQYWQLCVTCQAGADQGERQCSYCKTYRREDKPPRPPIHFSVSRPARRDRLGRTRGRPSWDVFLKERRIGHVYHDRHVWIYSFTYNPYRLFSANFPATKLGEINAFAAVADHIHQYPDVLQFWLTGRGVQYLESSYGPVAALAPVPLLSKEGWRVQMLITKRERDFANARDAIEWAKKLALKYMAPARPNTHQRGTASSRKAHSQ